MCNANKTLNNQTAQLNMLCKVCAEFQKHRKRGRNGMEQQ